MQIQTSTPSQSRVAKPTLATCQSGVERDLRTGTPLTWATIAHRRRLAKMNRELMRFLSRASRPQD